MPRNSPQQAQTIRVEYKPKLSPAADQKNGGALVVLTLAVPPPAQRAPIDSGTNKGNGVLDPFNRR
jgi:hypothetical protein